MKYALGNMLNGAGSINPDGLALDLQFAADKTLTARRGPTPVFSRGSTGTFVGSNGLIQSAAINTPRFDHDPVTLASRGLLIEEQRQNLLSRSEEFNQTVWTKLRASVSADLTTSPSGDSSADKLVEDSSSGTHMTYRLLNTGTLAAHTFSVFAKADGRDFVYLACADNFTANSFAYFNLTNGTLGTVGAGATASMTSFGNGWYRCSITATTTATTTNGVYIQTSSANGVISYQGDGTSGIFIWGAQLEAGSFATSYIPTTTSALTRSADVCNITGADFTSFYNQSEGTVLFIGDTVMPSTQTASRAMYSLNNGGYSSNISIAKSSTGSSVTISGTGLTSLVKTISPLSAQFKSAVAMSASKVVTSGFNGSVEDLVGTFTGVNFTRLTFYDASNNSNFWNNGHIAAIRYYKKRLPNAKLVTLTT